LDWLIAFAIGLNSFKVTRCPAILFIKFWNG
jgi:hypothetical protein